MDVPQKKATLKRSKDKKTSLQRPSLVRKVLALLIQYPNLQQVFVRQGLSLDGFEFAGRDLLVDVLQKIALEKPENAAMLLEVYRDSASERMVMILAGMALDVPDGGEEAEFSGALMQLLRQARQEQLSELLAKEGREGLGSEEKQLLRTLLKERL
jgi:DNA primase